MEKKIAFSGSSLKIIALVTMFIDHFGAVVIQRILSMPGFNHEFWNTVYWPVRNVGRLAFPIYCFLLVEGFLHTSNLKKYTGRMVLFALISEIPFNLSITGKFMNLHYQNVFWELVFGIGTMACLKAIEEKRCSYFWKVFLRLFTIAVFAFGAEALNFDYGIYGIISIAALYEFRQNKGTQLLAGAVSFCWEPAAMAAFLPIALYNGKRGKSLKYVFYAFYPLHLLVLYLTARVIGCQY